MTRKTPQRAANKNGSLRPKTVIKNGKEYKYWWARITTGYDSNGKQIQKGKTFSTQKDAARWLRDISKQLDDGNYYEPTKYTVEEWCKKWCELYNCKDVRPQTAALYARTIELYITPLIGNIKLATLTPIQVQDFINRLETFQTQRGKPLSPKTIKNIHGVLHKILKQAVEDRIISYNPSNGRKLPRIDKKERLFMSTDFQKAFIEAIRGHVHEYIYLMALFTGMRQSELLGLTWDCIDFDKKILTVKQQLKKATKKSGSLELAKTKNGKTRTIALADSLIKILALQKIEQNNLRIQAQELWVEHNLVFTNNVGDYLSYRTVYDCYKRIVKKLGIPEIRFHDLRHTYASDCIHAGDSLKTLQSNMGHATAAFTLDVYGHILEETRVLSAEHTESVIQSLIS